MDATDKRVSSQLQASGLQVKSYAGLLLREPAEVRVAMGGGRWVGHFGTLSPFMRWEWLAIKTEIWLSIRLLRTASWLFFKEQCARICFGRDFCSISRRHL